MSVLDYYFTVMSPWTYLAGLRLERMAARHGVLVNYKPLSMGAVFKETGGLPLKDRHPARQEYRLQDLPRSARHAGLPITLHPAHFPVNERPASVAIVAAQMAEYAVGPLTHAFLRAVWAEERDISDPQTVSAILDENQILESVLEPHLEAANATYEQNARDAVEAGVFGSPFYIIEGERFWGQDRLDMLEAHLAEIAG